MFIILEMLQLSWASGGCGGRGGGGAISLHGHLKSILRCQRGVFISRGNKNARCSYLSVTAATTTVVVTIEL